MQNKENTVPPVSGIDGAVQGAVFANQELSRDEIQKYMKRDMNGAAITIIEILNSKEAVEALTDVFYKRYQELKKNMVNESEIPDPD